MSIIPFDQRAGDWAAASAGNTTLSGIVRDVEQTFLHRCFVDWILAKVSKGTNKPMNTYFKSALTCYNTCIGAETDPPFGKRYLYTAGYLIALCTPRLRGGIHNGGSRRCVFSPRICAQSTRRVSSSRAK